MKVHIGIWHDHIAMFMQEQYPTLLCLSLERNDRGCTRVFIAEGYGTTSSLNCVDADELMCYPYRVISPREENDGFTRCSLTPVYLNPHIRGWTVDLPPDHELPWPKCRTCNSYDASEELFIEVKKRVASAIAAGVRPPPPPAYIQAKFTPAMRMELFNYGRG